MEACFISGQRSQSQPLIYSNNGEGLRNLLDQHKHIDDDEPVIFCHVSEKLFPGKESYRLTISDNKIRIVASDLSGLHFAIVTLVQLFRLYYHESKYNEELAKSNTKDRHNNENIGDKQDSSQAIAELIPVYISDFPDCTSRAVLLDLNPYGRVPKKVHNSSMKYKVL